MILLASICRHLVLTDHPFHLIELVDHPQALICESWFALLSSMLTHLCKLAPYMSPTARVNDPLPMVQKTIACITIGLNNSPIILQPGFCNPPRSARMIPIEHDLKLSPTTSGDDPNIGFLGILSSFFPKNPKGSLIHLNQRSGLGLFF